MLKTLTIVGSGEHASSKNLSGVYVCEKKRIGSCGSGLNLHVLNNNLELLQSQAFDTANSESDVTAMLEKIKTVESSNIICIHSAGAWEDKVTPALVQQLHDCGCKLINEICQLRLNDTEAKMNGFGQPFAFIGKSGIGFGYGEQNVVLINTDDSFGYRFATVSRMYDLTTKNKNLQDTGKIIDGAISENENACVRLLDMIVKPPQQPGSEGDSEEDA